ncbi:SH3 domain-containing protein [Enterocloster bolteae]|uniref:C40 family peptidase n=1 Tax=Enterocloster bolteae TaxID=208479 RepID=UPI0028DAF964|nr:SH3 domain-containing protein [Enterocloster bolteae]
MNLNNHTRKQNPKTRTGRRRSRKKRERRVSPKWIAVPIGIILAAVLCFAGRRFFVHQGNSVAGSGQESGSISREDSGAGGTVMPATPASAVYERSAHGQAADNPKDDGKAEKEAVVAAYHNLGIIDVSGYLNVRETADSQGKIIGQISQNGACEILGTEGEWYQVTSGEVDGYIHSQYVLTGEAAIERAVENVKLMAVITADSLNIRSSPTLDAENITGAASRNERYEVTSQTEGWVETSRGYLAAEYVEVRYALNEARELDLISMALNQYDNLVISKVDNYLNVRSSPESQGDSNIIGKMPGQAAGEILETEDGWYKIRSGSITGYITSDPQYTAVGEEARQIAGQAATLMAIVSTDRLNVRTEPTTESGIWTQISKEERYHVVRQMDGWVQIELDTTGEGEETDGAYISTRENNVEVRYALAEAIKFSPLEVQAGQAGSLRNRVVNYAVQFVGNPYVWGGTSLTNGTDCSGFVLSVMRNFGVSLPRTSIAQSGVGTAVSSSEMQPGDLVFYANGSGTVNHVAMYIGNGQVVHASSRKTGIKISTWNYRTPKTIRRVL